MDGAVELWEDAVGAFGFEAEHLGVPGGFAHAGFERDGVVDGEVSRCVSGGVSCFGLS